MQEQYLSRVELNRSQIPDSAHYPFCIPAVRGLNSLPLHPKVTFLVGENGTGKSTLTEAIAVAYGFNAEGGSRNFNFSTFHSESGLWNYLELVRGVKHARDGYFLRAESFYNVATNIEQMDDSPGGPKISDSYGGSLHECSHGEGFFALLNNRLRGHGLYIFDEPEAALSPQRQLAMLCRIHELVKLDSQLIIATHSPILTAYPDCTIYELSTKGIRTVDYEQTDNYRVTREFLNSRQKMLRLLLDGSSVET